MSIQDNNENDSTVVECDRCGYECDPRGLSQHKNSARCDYLKDKRFREQEGFTHDLSGANKFIRNWIRRNTEDGVKQLCSRFSLGGPSWNPTTGYKHYTTPEAWEAFLRENRLTNPQKQADEKVKIEDINQGQVAVQYDDEYQFFSNELETENKRKAWVRESKNRDVVLYTVSGERIGIKTA
jgi:hypothetical protein